MKWVLRTLISVAAAVGLYLLWPPRTVLWWALLSMTVLMLVTALALRAAIRERASADFAPALNPRLAARKSSPRANENVRFWFQANGVVSVIVLVLSVLALLQVLSP
jgi:hypothetical protein